MLEFVSKKELIDGSVGILKNRLLYPWKLIVSESKFRLSNVITHLILKSVSIDLYSQNRILLLRT